MPQQHQLATWSPTRDRWETPEVDIFGHSVAYSETLPKSGMTRGGRLYERPTLAPRTTGPASSSSPRLPTPKAADGIMGRPRTTGRPIEKSTHLGTITTLLPNADAPCLPTPTASDADKERNNPSQARRKSPPLSAISAHFTDLSILVENDLLASGGVVLPTPTGQFLPSPTASDASGGGMHPDHPGRQGHTMQLPDYVLLADEPDRWGKYAPAIHRWEQIVGPAPAPTEPNKNGKPRLNAAFAEWMMGLPAGWVTAPEIGISRAEQLKAIGNGVCPQQAAAALRALFAMPAGEAA